jgi:hypothetical protein
VSAALAAQRALYIRDQGGLGGGGVPPEDRARYCAFTTAGWRATPSAHAHGRRTYPGTVEEEWVDAGKHCRFVRALPLCPENELLTLL